MAALLPFLVPPSLQDLQVPPQQEHRLYARKVIHIQALSPNQVQELIEGVSFELAAKEVVCIEEQGIFDQLFSLIRDFSSLEPSAKTLLIESLCANFSVLLPNITALIASLRDPGSDRPFLSEHIHSHRNSFKIYAYFLHCIIASEEAAAESLTEQSALKSKQARRKHIPKIWNWELQRTRIICLLASSLEVELGKLFGAASAEDRLFTLLAKGAFSMLENPAVLKDKGLKEALSSIIGVCSTKYQLTVQSSASILHLVHKYEHLPLYLAEVVATAEQKYQNGSLAVSLLREIGRLNPNDYARDNAAADNIGKFLIEIADRLPKLVATNVGILIPHFHGESHKIRSALVSVLGKLVSKAFSDVDSNTCSGITRLCNKQAMIDILCARSRDTSAYTRSRVLQTWSELCEEHALSIGLWNPIADMAAGRLEDKAALVRKSALQLLAALLQYNPFGPHLRTAAFEATLEKYNGQLNAMSSQSTADVTDGEQKLENSAHDDLGGNCTKEVSGHDSGAYNNDSLQLERIGEQGGSSDMKSQTQDMDHTSDIGGLEQTRALVASLEAGLHFAKCMASIMPVSVQLLASPTATDVEQTIHLLIYARQFNIDGAEHCLRKMLPLVFSQEKGISETVESSFVIVYTKKNPTETAFNLIDLTLEASLGDLASLEVLIDSLIRKSEISKTTVSVLWDIFTFNAPGITQEQSRGALVVLCMAAKSSPKILSSRLLNIVDIGFGRWAKEDMLLARTACIALQRVTDEDRLSLLSNHKILHNLANLIITTSLPEDSWYATAEQAINAIYSLHPMPDAFSARLLQKFHSSIFVDANSSLRAAFASDINLELAGSGTVGGDVEQLVFPVILVSRFLFVVGHVALKHLVHIETCIRTIRRSRADKERAAALDTQESDNVVSPVFAEKDPKEENINAELGISVSEDVKLDSLQEEAEKEIVSGIQNRLFLLGTCAPFVAKICKCYNILQKFPYMQSSAVLALCKLMVIDANFCDKNLQILFTIAQNAANEHVRMNCIIAFGDLAVRFPNLLEPWTEHVYARLHDSSQLVRKNAVLVLSHLILNDMMKIKGHISEMALRLDDEDPHISSLVKLFFHELSKKGSNPIYNLLPDILSRLSRANNLPQESFCNIMQFLISSIKKEKQMEGLIEKLCHRFCGLTDPTQWRDIAYCLSQLTYSERGIKKFADMFKSYQHTLGVEEVLKHFRGIVSKARKFAKSDLKAFIDELEDKIVKCYEENKEQEMTMQNVFAHQQEGAAQLMPEMDNEVRSDSVNINEGTSTITKEHEMGTVSASETASTNQTVSSTKSDLTLDCHPDNSGSTITVSTDNMYQAESTLIVNRAQIKEENVHEDYSMKFTSKDTTQTRISSAAEVFKADVKDRDDEVQAEQGTFLENDLDDTYEGREDAVSKDSEASISQICKDEDKEDVDIPHTYSHPVTRSSRKTRSMQSGQLYEH